MSISDAIALFFIMTTLALVPSSSVLLIVTRSVTLGLANGIAVSVGVVLGDLVFILLALYGLAFVAEQYLNVFLILKYVGVLYLFWLAYTLLKIEKTSETKQTLVAEKSNLVTSLLAGFFLTLGDVKAIFFYVSLLPVFIDMAEMKFADSIILITIMMLSVGGVKVGYAVFAMNVSTLLKKKKYGHFLTKTAGLFVLMAGCAILLEGLDVV